MNELEKEINSKSCIINSKSTLIYPVNYFGRM